MVANCDRFHPAPGCGNFCIFSIRPPSAVDLKRRIAVQSENCAYTADAIKVCLCFDLGCSCDAVGGGFPRRYLAWHSPHTRAGCFSCQLSNITHKKVDAPRRGCTYGPMAYADCHEDCRNTGVNIHKNCCFPKAFCKKCNLLNYRFLDGIRFVII